MYVGKDFSLLFCDCGEDSNHLGDHLCIESEKK